VVHSFPKGSSLRRSAIRLDRLRWNCCSPRVPAGQGRIPEARLLDGTGPGGGVAGLEIVEKDGHGADKTNSTFRSS